MNIAVLMRRHKMVGCRTNRYRRSQDPSPSSTAAVHRQPPPDALHRGATSRGCHQIIRLTRFYAIATSCHWAPALRSCLHHCWAVAPSIVAHTDNQSLQGRRFIGLCQCHHWATTPSVVSVTNICVEWSLLEVDPHAVPPPLFLPRSDGFSDPTMTMFLGLMAMAGLGTWPPWW
jgi:hypothetical protein